MYDRVYRCHDLRFFPVPLTRGTTLLVTESPCFHARSSMTDSCGRLLLIAQTTSVNGHVVDDMVVMLASLLLHMALLHGWCFLMWLVMNPTNSKKMALFRAGDERLFKRASPYAQPPQLTKYALFQSYYYTLLESAPQCPTHIDCHLIFRLLQVDFFINEE